MLTFARSVWHTAGTAEPKTTDQALRTRYIASLHHDWYAMGALVLLNALLSSWCACALHRMAMKHYQLSIPRAVHATFWT